MQVSSSSSELAYSLSTHPHSTGHDKSQALLSMLLSLLGADCSDIMLSTAIARRSRSLPIIGARAQIVKRRPHGRYDLAKLNELTKAGRLHSTSFQCTVLRYAVKRHTFNTFAGHSHGYNQRYCASISVLATCSQEAECVGISRLTCRARCVRIQDLWDSGGAALVSNVLSSRNTCKYC